MPPRTPTPEDFEALIQSIPYARTLGVEFTRQASPDPILHRLKFSQSNIGNPSLNALHGGATAAFLEIAAVVQLSWTDFHSEHSHVISPQKPQTISFSTEYLRIGRAEDAYAYAYINRKGRRYASVRVEAWQGDDRKCFAQGSGFFLMPQLKAHGPEDQGSA